MSTVEHGRPVGPWLVGALAAGVVALALWLANTGPTLAYTTADDEDSAVTCTGRAETNDTPWSRRRPAPGRSSGSTAARTR